MPHRHKTAASMTTTVGQIPNMPAASASRADADTNIRWKQHNIGRSAGVGQSKDRWPAPGPDDTIDNRWLRRAMTIYHVTDRIDPIRPRTRRGSPDRISHRLDSSTPEVPSLGTGSANRSRPYGHRQRTHVDLVLLSSGVAKSQSIMQRVVCKRPNGTSRMPDTIRRPCDACQQTDTSGRPTDVAVGQKASRIDAIVDDSDR